MSTTKGCKIIVIRIGQRVCGNELVCLEIRRN